MNCLQTLCRKTYRIRPRRAPLGRGIPIPFRRHRPGNEPSLHPGEGEELPAPYVLDGGGRAPDPYGHCVDPCRISRAAWEAPSAGYGFLAASEACKLVAQESEVLVVPVVMAGISAHHLGFSGSLTLSPALFEEVIFETVQALIHHGIRKIAFYNGHGGNGAALGSVINRINNSTIASAVDLGEIQRSQRESPFPAPAMDYHAGVGETSWMLYLTPQLVDMSKAENPVLTPPASAQEALESMTGANANLVGMTHLFRPDESGKMAASHQISSNGVFTTGDLAESSAAQGRFRFDHFVEDAVRFIEEWRGIGS